MQTLFTEISKKSVDRPILQSAPTAARKRTLDSARFPGYNKNRRGRRDKRSARLSERFQKKPSLGRVAVSAFYPYRYGISEDM